MDKFYFYFVMKVLLRLICHFRLCWTVDMKKTFMGLYSIYNVCALSIQLTDSVCLRPTRYREPEVWEQKKQIWTLWTWSLHPNVNNWYPVFYVIETKQYSRWSVFQSNSICNIKCVGSSVKLSPNSSTECFSIFSLLFWFYSQQLNSQVEPLSSHQPLVLVKKIKTSNNDRQN